MSNTHKVVYEVGKNREAGAHVQVIDNRDGSFEAHDGDRDMNWVTFCDTHGNYCLHRARMTAEGLAHHPTEWCETCREEGQARPKQEQEQTKTRTSKEQRREIDRQVFLAVFNNWAVGIGEIVSSTSLTLKEVRNSLSRLSLRNLVVGEAINFDKELTYQTYFDVENGSTEEEALASFEENYA